MSLLTCYAASSASARMAAAVSSRRTCSSPNATTTCSPLNQHHHRRHHHHPLSVSRTHFSDNITAITTSAPAAPAVAGCIRLRSIKEGYRNHRIDGALASSSSSKRSASYSSSVLATPAAAVGAGASATTENEDSARRFWEVLLSGLVAVAASTTLVVGLPSSSSSSVGATATPGYQNEQLRPQEEHQHRHEEYLHHPLHNIILSKNHLYATEGDFPPFVAGQQIFRGGDPISGGGENGGEGGNRGFSSSDVAYASLMFADQQHHHHHHQQPFEHHDDMHHVSSTKQRPQGGPENSNKNKSNHHHHDDDDKDGKVSSSSSSSTVSDGRRRRKNYDISVRAIKGGRVTMEDEYFVSKGGRFAAVFDGHGGGGVSQLLRNKLYEWVVLYLKQKHWEDDEDDSMIDPASAAAAAATSPASSSTSSSTPMVTNMDIDSGISDKVPSISSYVAALRMAFSKVEADVLAKDALKYQGSTAVAVLLHESHDDGSGISGGVAGHQRTLVSANVGDSRAILSRRGRAIDLTRDHKPNEEREKARILAMGETIEWDSFSKVHRVRNLSLSRAIGDRYAKPAVSGQVEIKIFPVAEVDDEFFLLASDGLWDVMSSQDVVNYVHKRFDAELKRVPEMSKEDKENYKLVLRRNMARSVAREAYRRGSGDNICVLMVWLKDFSPSS